MTDDDEPTFRARLDHAGVFWGVEQVPALAPGDVPVPVDCDLRPGAYRWDAGTRRFEPLPRQRQCAAPAAPTLEEAFAALLEHGPGHPTVLAWRGWFDNSVDGTET